MLRQQPAPVFRDTARFTIEPLASSKTTVRRDPCRLEWSAGPDGTLYTLEVATDELDVVHRVEGLEQASALVPAEALAEIADGEKVLWRVEAFLPNGETLASSTFVVTLESRDGS